jgi:hypothetical protein
MGMAVGILFLAVLCAEILLLPVWASAMSISGIILLPVALATTPFNSRTQNMDVIVGILFSTVLCADIRLLPVWAAAIFSSDIILLPVALATTPFNSWTPKHGCGHWNFVSSCPMC